MCRFPTVSNLDLKSSKPILTINPVFLKASGSQKFMILTIFDSCEIFFALPPQVETVGIRHVPEFLPRLCSLEPFYIEDIGKYCVFQCFDDHKKTSQISVSFLSLIRRFVVSVLFVYVSLQWILVQHDGCQANVLEAMDPSFSAISAFQCQHGSIDPTLVVSFLAAAFRQIEFNLSRLKT